MIGLFLGFSAGLATSPFARANGRCEFLFLSDSYLGTPANFQTVKIAGKLKNETGETFFRLRKITERISWLSTYSPHNYDPQGDPTWGFSTLGYELARSMGYRYERGGTLIVPTAETLNQHIERFNIFLGAKKIAPIPIRFYAQPKTSLILFIREWARRQSLPVAGGQGNHTIHDISYHYPGIMLPPEVTRLMQTEAQIALAWNELEPQLARVNHLRTVSLMIDNQSVTANRRPSREMDDHAATRFLERYLRPKGETESLSPELYVRHSPLDAFFRRLRFGGHAIPEKQEQLFRDYAAVYHPAWVKPLSEYGLRDIESLRDLYNDRSQRLRDAAVEYWNLYGDD